MDRGRRTPSRNGGLDVGGLNQGQANRAIDKAIRAAGGRPPATEPEFSAIALRILRHPYRLTTIDSIGFSTADAAALRLGMQTTSPLRAIAALRHVLQSAATEGHTAMFVNELKKRAGRVLCGMRMDDIHAEAPDSWSGILDAAITSINEVAEQVAFPSGHRDDEAPAALLPLVQAECSSAKLLADPSSHLP